MFNIFSKTINIFSPVKGRFKNKEEINDPVFSKGLMGVTFVIDPSDNKIYAPMDSQIITVFPTKHAIGIGKDGVEMILHIGIDTVSLKGEGFKVFVKEGQMVKKGDLLMEVDFDLISEKGLQRDVIVIVSKFKKTVLNNVENVDNNIVVGKCE